MLKSQVQIGGHYTAKVSNVLTTVRIDSVLSNGKGWTATNLSTQRKVHIKSAAKLRGEAKTNPVVKQTNGNGERMVTPNQTDLINKLLDERTISDDLTNRYHTASLEARVTLAAADQFIKHLLRSPRKDDDMSKGKKHSAPKVDQVKLTTERLASIGHDGGVDMVTDSFEDVDIINNTVEAIIADIAGSDIAANVHPDAMNGYVTAYLDGVLSGVTKQINAYKSEFAPKQTRTKQR